MKVTTRRTIIISPIFAGAVLLITSVIGAVCHFLHSEEPSIAEKPEGFIFVSPPLLKGGMDRQ
jgi:hypothetical protein